MKKYSLALLGISLHLLTYAQSEKYGAAMQKTLSLFDSAKTVNDFNTAANSFERIGDAEKTQWLPYYYAALALSTSGWMPEVTDKDAQAASITAFCDKAEALASSNADKSEIMTVRNMASTQQMIVDPPNRYMTYGMAASQAIDKGIELNPNNPRLYYLRGMSLFNTPSQFGGGKDKAKPLFEKAATLYKEEKPTQFYPHWGEKQNADMIAQCNQ